MNLIKARILIRHVTFSMISPGLTQGPDVASPAARRMSPSPTPPPSLSWHGRMATPTGPPLVSRWHGEVLETRAAGTRDVLIIGSLTDSPSPDVVPRCDFEPTEQDRRRLANQGVHVDSYDDLSVIKARVARDKNCSLVGEEVSAPGRELTREHVLKRLAAVMSNCKADGGTWTKQT